MSLEMDPPGWSLLPASPLKSSSSSACAAPKEREKLWYQGAGNAKGLSTEKPQCYLAGFDHLWGLCLVLPGDPQ